MWIKQFKSFSELTSVILDSKTTVGRSHPNICFRYNQMHHPHQDDNLTGFFCSTHDNLSMSVFIILLSWKLPCRLPVHYLYTSLKQCFALSKMPSNLSFCICQNYLVIGHCCGGFLFVFFFFSFRMQSVLNRFLKY